MNYFFLFRIRNNEWDEKGKELNEKLKKQCNYLVIPFITHDNIVSSMKEHAKQ